jgi:hypothetical protein
LGFGCYWFFYNLTLSDEARGLKCCDAAEYLSYRSTAEVWNVSGRRAFGYPLFIRFFGYLAQIRGKFSFENYDWLTPALYTQMVVWIVTCFIVFFTLRRADKHYRPLFLGLLLAHPALAAYAASSLTDSLATSLVTLALVCLIQVGTRPNRFWLWSLLASLTLGFATSMRPNLLGILMLTCLAFGITVIRRGMKEHWGRKKTAILTAAVLSVFLVGTIPTVGKVFHNCYRKYGHVCVVEPDVATAASLQSLGLGLSQARVWSSLTLGVRGSEDPLISRLGSSCREKLGPPAEMSVSKWLLRCYTSFPALTAATLFKKLFAAFDHLHLGPYTPDTTTRFEFYLNRVFSYGGLLGFFCALFLCIRGLFDGSIVEKSYLVLLLCFVAIQINLHIDPRYFFPAVPIFFLTFLRCASYMLTQRARIAMPAFGAWLIILSISIVMTHHWDMIDCWYLHDRIPDWARTDGLMTDCAPADKVRARLELYRQNAPEWPTW